MTTWVDVEYLPRKMEFEELIRVLIAEHSLMRNHLETVRDAAGRGDFQTASTTLRELAAVFRQHIADEESQILRLLIGELGVNGAREEIKVFQQHRPIHQLMEMVAKLASLPPGKLEADQKALKALFDEHTTAEEGRVFPRAVACFRQKDTGK